MFSRIPFVGGAPTSLASPITQSGNVVSELYGFGASITSVNISSGGPGLTATINGPSVEYAIDLATLPLGANTGNTWQVDVVYDISGTPGSHTTFVDLVVVPPLSLIQDGECVFTVRDPSGFWGSFSLSSLDPNVDVGGGTAHYIGSTTAGDASFAGELTATGPAGSAPLTDEPVTCAYRFHQLVGQGNPLTRIDVFPDPLPSLCGAALQPPLVGVPSVPPSGPSGLMVDQELRPTAAPTTAGDQDLALTVNNGDAFFGTISSYPRSSVPPVVVRRIDFATDGTSGVSEQVPSADIGSVPANQRDFTTTDDTFDWSLGAGGATEIMVDTGASTSSSLVVEWTATLPPNTYGIQIIGTPTDTGVPVAAGDASVVALPSAHTFALTLTPDTITVDTAATIDLTIMESPAFVDGETIELTLLSGHPDLTFSGSPANTLSGTATAGNDGTFPIQVEVAVFDSGGELVEIGSSDVVNLTVDPAVVSSDPLAVAVLLDRSGSMNSSDRWASARSAAHCFGDLLVDDDDGHHYGLYWFSGASSTATDNADPAQLGSSYGTVTGLDMVAVDTSTPLDASAGSPGGSTSVGAGLLHARERILAAAPGGARRAVLVLSDGIENRQPSMARVFTNGDEPGIDNITAGPTAPWLDGGDPDIDVYAVAIATTASWHDRLVARIGSLGQPANHVTTLDKATASIDLHNWFLARFTELAGLTECDVPIDPTLTGVEGVAEHPALVSTGHSKLIFHLFVEDDADDWRIGLRPPDRANGSPEDTIVADMPGISFRKGPLYHVVTVDFPIAAAGFEHHWAGQWTLEVERTADGEGNYATSAIVKGDVHPSFGVLQPARPRDGDEVVLRAVLRDGRHPLRGASVSAVVTPLPYIDDAVARLTEGGAVTPRGDDIHTPQDKVLADAAAAGESIEVDSPAGTTQQVVFEEVAPGVYDGAFIADAPGVWDLHASFDGKRGGIVPSKKVLTARAKLNGLRHHYPAAAFLADARLHDARIYAPKPFHYERRSNVLVHFVPDWVRTRAMARLWLGKGGPRLRVSVRPVDRAGRLLGPGWGHAVSFGLPGVPFAPTIRDGGEGTYYIDAKLGGRGLSIDRFRRVVAGPRLSLGDRRLATGRLDLRYLQAKILRRGAILPVRFAVDDSLKTEPVFMHDLFSELAEAAGKLRVRDGELARGYGERGEQLQRSLRHASDSRLPSAQRAHALRTARQLAAELAEAAESETERRFTAALYGGIAEVEANGWAPDGAATLLVGAQSLGRIASKAIADLTERGAQLSRPRSATEKKPSKKKPSKKKPSKKKPSKKKPSKKKPSKKKKKKS
jgi:hypothetical protein